MQITKPFEAVTKLKYFLARIERLENDQYSDKKFRTADLKKLKFEWPKISLLCSLALFNKNDATDLVNKCRAKKNEIKNYIQ